MYGCTNCTLEIICIHTKTIFCNILITTQMDQLLSHRKKKFSSLGNCTIYFNK